MKYIVSVIFFAFIFFIAVSLVALRDSPGQEALRERIEYVTGYIRQWFRVKKHNIAMEHDFSLMDGNLFGTDPDSQHRRPPNSLLLTRTELEAFLPSDFVKTLYQDDWDYIFSLIYDPVEDKEGDFTVKRYLTREEIETQLINDFRYPFNHFRRQHWGRFWQISLR